MPSKTVATIETTGDGCVRLASLTDASKQEVWRYLATQREDLAIKLKEAAENPVVRILLEQHDATLVIEANILPRQLRASLAFITN